jgi:hypothetical protein
MLSFLLDHFYFQNRFAYLMNMNLLPGGSIYHVFAAEYELLGVWLMIYLICTYLYYRAFFFRHNGTLKVAYKTGRSFCAGWMCIILVFLMMCRCFKK